MKKVLFIVVLLMMTALFSTAAVADEAYDITDYDVHIIVSEDNVLDVVERLTVDFSMERHGIYYYRQYKGVKYNKIDGEAVATPFWYSIKDLDVIGHKFDKSIYTYGSDKYIELKIGDPDRTIIGEQEYIITYKSFISEDGFEEFDEFYQDILYCEYGDTIERASFIIEFPKNIDEKNVVVLLGEYGSVSSGGVYYEVDGDTIKGYTTRRMSGGEVLTVRVQMEQGYFTSSSDPYAVMRYAIFGVTGACLLLAFILWIAFGKDKAVFPTVEFYPPDDMTSAEAGYIIDGTVDNQDVISMIIYWADKGHINIIDHGKNDIELERVSSLPSDAKAYEKKLFGDLFSGGDKIDISTYKNTFYTKMQSAKTGVKNYFESSKNRRVFTKKSRAARSAMGLITMVPVALSMFLLVYISSSDFITAAIVAAVTSVLISLPVFMLVRLFERWRSTKHSKRVAKMVFSFILIGLVLTIYMFAVPWFFEAFRPGFTYPITVSTGVATLILMGLASIMRKRTDQGSSWYGKLLGFREFIERAEKDRILMLVEENPNYFYKVLPYAYVLGVTDKWAKKFEGIKMQQPGWYSGYYPGNVFTTMYFVNTMSRSMSHIQQVATSKPSSSGSGGGYSGGGFSGGGFSGGGGGGGGAGGSW